MVGFVHNKERGNARKDKFMEYYAKSTTIVLTKEEREKRTREIQLLRERLQENFNDWELKILEAAIEKLKEQKEPEQQKLLSDHLEEIVRCAERFFDSFGAYFTEREKQFICYACQKHDIGKANALFQAIVRPGHKAKWNEKQIPHGFLSALVLSKKDFIENCVRCTQKKDFDIVLTAIYNHHTRDDDYKKEDFEKFWEKHFKEQIREFCNNPDMSIRTQNLGNLLFRNDTSYEYKIVDDDVWCEYMLVKGMLNKFDWAVSAGYQEIEYQTDLYDKRLCRKIAEEYGNSFRPVQAYMYEKREDNLVVVAPTGSGKTEAALLWLNGEKGFYTLPLKVSSNAIYDRIRKRYQYEDVVLLHSDSMNIYLKEATESEQPIDGYELYARAKLLSAPLTVCTVDQLFKFVYKALGTEIFAATLKYSKIIIDEIQSYEPKVVAALIYGLMEIVKMGGRFAIITATFPPVLRYFMERQGLLQDHAYEYRDFSMNLDLPRHKVKIRRSQMDIDEIAEKGKMKKVLVICNTVSKAQKIYEQLDEMYGNVCLLHARYTREHRRMLEDRIKKFSEERDVPGIWVTTQIVEASLDIDFEFLYTEMCTADSLLQRMGRCNRSGRYTVEEENVIVCDTGTEYKHVYDEDIYQRSSAILQRYEGRVFTEADKTVYMNEVYDVEQIRSTQYFKLIEKSLRELNVLQPLEYTKTEVAKEFRGIRSVKVIPEKIYKENQDMIDSIQAFLGRHYGEHTVKSMLQEKLGEMTLSIHAKNGFPEHVDHAIIENTDIHRTEWSYDFDIFMQKGLGLRFDKVEEEESFL